MPHEPDWEALGQLQFLLMRRITEPLNAGLAAISLMHLDSAADKPREYWQQRATGEVMGVLNLVNAWHALIRYKLGELLPRQHIKPFRVQELLDWLSYQLELVNPLHVEENMAVESSREALQEALLLMYSAAYTLGPNVHLIVQSTPSGVWFRVRFSHTGTLPCPKSLDELIERLAGNWRLEDTAFELQTAADFIALSGSQLHLQGTTEFCEMAFFIYAVGKRPPEPRSTDAVQQPPPIATNEHDEVLISYAQTKVGEGDDTRPLPEADVEAIIQAALSANAEADANAPDAEPGEAQYSNNDIMIAKDETPIFTDEPSVKAVLAKIAAEQAQTIDETPVFPSSVEEIIAEQEKLQATATDEAATDDRDAGDDIQAPDEQETRQT